MSGNQQAAHMVLEQAEHLTKEQIEDLASAQACIRGGSKSDKANVRFLLAKLADAIPEDRRDEYWELIGGRPSCSKHSQ